MNHDQDIQDIEHFATIIAGCENINLVTAEGGKLSYEGNYAQSVLRLSAQTDLGAFAGNESVGSAIKSGAENVVKWIKQFVASINEMLKKIANGFSKSKVDAAAKQMSSDDVKKEIEEEMKAAHKKYVPLLETAIAAVKIADENKSEALGQLNNFGILITNLEKAKKSAEDASSSFPNDLWAAKEILRINIPRCNTALENYASKEGKKDKEMTQGVSNVKGLSVALSKVSAVTDKFIEDAQRLYKKVKAAEDAK